MPTHVLYIDDSGTKEYAASPELYGTTGNSRYFVFGGVLISTAESGKLATRIRETKRLFFDTDAVEIKSNWLRIPKERKKRYLAHIGFLSRPLPPLWRNTTASSRKQISS